MHVDREELVDMALGENVRSETTAHVAECPECRAEVVALRATTLRVRAVGPDHLETPPEDLWPRIEAEAEGETETGDAPTPLSLVADPAPPVTPMPSVTPAPSATPASPEPKTPPAAPAPPATATPPVTPLPPPAPAPLSARPAAAPVTGVPMQQVPSPSGHPAHDRGARGPRVSARWLVAAVLAGMLAGGLGTWFATSRSSASTTVLATTSLSTLDTNKPEATATLQRTSSGVDVAIAPTTPLTAPDGYLEVWLINTDLKRMVSIGVLRPGESAQAFPIDAALIAQGYRIVDISREAFDDQPQHSGVSLVRGTFPA